MTLVVFHLLEDTVEHLLVPVRRIALVVEERREVCRQLILEIVVVEPVGVNARPVDQLLDLAGEGLALPVRILKLMRVAKIDQDVVKRLFLESDAKRLELMLVLLNALEQIQQLAGQLLDLAMA